MPDTFKALIADIESDELKIAITDRTLEDLPNGNTLIEVKYSSLNYKDGMALDGNKGKVLRKFPISPGIDLAGIVKTSSDNSFNTGDEVIVTGWGLGETHSGGYSQMARVNSEWMVSKPSSLSLKHSMSIGTAGLTAMLCVMALENSGVANSNGEILVTGAAGGVGNISIMILSKLGYSVTAMTGRTELEPYLKNIGATKIIHRNEILELTRPLNSIKWAGAIDTTGGSILSNLISAIDHEGAVAACGNAAGIKLSTTVLPFLLRGVNLIGINSVYCPIERRITAWNRLGDLINPAEFEEITQEINLHNINKAAKEILAGEIRGRTVVNIANM
jgi:acrylyl-CoA reductase (NADPH)